VPVLGAFNSVVDDSAEFEPRIVRATAHLWSAARRRQVAARRPRRYMDVGECIANWTCSPTKTASRWQLADVRRQDV